MSESLEYRLRQVNEGERDKAQTTTKRSCSTYTFTSMYLITWHSDQVLVPAETGERPSHHYQWNLHTSRISQDPCRGYHNLSSPLSRVLYNLFELSRRCTTTVQLQASRVAVFYGHIYLSCQLYMFHTYMLFISLRPMHMHFTYTHEFSSTNFKPYCFN
ncbi:hypothetical protein Taro_040632 [Colocasia esculenta]|uniref:Uncharacterized protein n=1 Tax=Colocasia esculenta TaxID=4460 RepID=A0A843WJI7_COLES|nr:hypothetical protein [Colocasia esculenta]